MGTCYSFPHYAFTEMFIAFFLGIMAQNPCNRARNGAILWNVVSVLNAGASN